MLKAAVVVPAMSDLNTLYAAAPRLAGWLRHLGHEVTVVDLSLETFLAMFSRAGLLRLFAAVDPRALRGETEDVYLQRERYLRVIDAAVRFLQGGEPTMAHPLARGDLLPDGPHLRDAPPRARQAAFGPWGKVDLARHLVTLMLLDLTLLFRTVSPHLGFVSYGEGLATSRSSFDALAAELARPPNAIEELMIAAAEAHIPADTELVCFTCPFPGMLFGALLLGKWLAVARPGARRVLGGGYPSTELRSVEDPRLFDFIDDLVLDDGELPLARICARREGHDAALCRTFTRDGGRVVWHGGDGAPAPRFRDLPTPDYRGVRMDRYLHPITAAADPFARLLNDGPWLKLTAAHGCYWKRCTFCDIHLAYIDDFEPLPAARLADQMDELHAQTGLSSFHFTDEAAPPPLLVNLALELRRRDRSYSYWGNIRYDPGFTPDRCRLLAASGLIAVTGGVEIASDALLPRLEKGITVRQVVKVLQAFAGADILTHAYLIYGFPGETIADTVDSLETVRQLMAAKLLSSAFFHRFSVTAHSPVGRRPERFGIRVTGPATQGFGRYNLTYDSVSVPAPSPRVHAAVARAASAYARGEGLGEDVRSWFGDAVPAPTVGPTFVADLMQTPHPTTAAPSSRPLWLGGVPRWSRGLLQVSDARGEIVSVAAPRELADRLLRCHPSQLAAAPPPGDLEPGDWVEPWRARGLVLV